MAEASAGASPARSAGRPVRFGSGLVLGGILTLAAALRFAQLGHNSVWFDEAYLVKLALVKWPDLLSAFGTAEFHPPLQYALVKAWIGVAGVSDTAIRIPSACVSLLSVALTYALARRFVAEDVSLLSAFLVAVSPFAVMAGQDAKMYALLGTLTLASTLVLVQCVEDGRLFRWVLYLAAVTAMLYTHYLGFLVVIAHGAWMASYERRLFWRWAAAFAAAGLLFAPWIPTLFTQLGRTPTWGPGDAVGLRDLSQLLGLFAFGGSLLGMPSFFFIDSSRPPIEQLIILLPFLVVTWRGATALASDRRALACLGAPVVLAIGVPFAISLARPAFSARWFSFLVPFYAMVVAQGVFDIRERFRDRRAWTLAMLTASLLIYSVPVLARYYVDPAFRPYQWRSMAALVGRQVKPGDVFLYGDFQNALAFTYYFGVSHPGMVLQPHPDFAAIRTLTARHSRVWLVVAPPFREAMVAQTLSELRDAFTVVGHSRVNRPPVFPVVYLLQAKHPAPGVTPHP
jgi:mannosyltransferase